MVQKSENGVGGAGKGEYNSGVECVLKGNLLVVLRYRKMENKGRSKGGKREGCMVRKGRGRGRWAGWQLGLTWQREAKTGSSNVLSITRGA